MNNEIKAKSSKTYIHFIVDFDKSTDYKELLKVIEKLGMNKIKYHYYLASLVNKKLVHAFNKILRCLNKFYILFSKTRRSMTSIQVCLKWEA